jgi:hypothetical protein
MNYEFWHQVAVFLADYKIELIFTKDAIIEITRSGRTEKYNVKENKLYRNGIQYAKGCDDIEKMCGYLIVDTQIVTPLRI